MSKIDTLRKRYGLSKSMKAHSVLNHALRASVPGASYILSALEVLNGVPSPKGTATPPSLSTVRPAPQQDTLLGAMSDAAAAKLLGVSHFTARKRRVALGIPAFAGNRARIDWARWDAQIASSTMTTEGLAQTIGCDTSTVRERRRFLKSKKGKYAHE